MRAFLAVCALLVGTSVASANVTVNGQGKVTYVPDVGYVTVGVSSKGKTAQEAWEKNKALVERLFDVLKAHGVDPKDMQTVNLTIRPEYTRPKDQEPVLVGYVVGYDLKVTVRKLADLGPVLDDLVAAGANQSVSIAFGLADAEKLMDEARVKAVADARRKADLYTTAAGTKLGRVVAISEVQVYHPVEQRFELAMPGAKDSLRIAQGQQELSVGITVVYGLSPAE